MLSSDITDKTRTWLGLLAAVLIVFFMLFNRLGDLALLSPDEGRNAEVAREMLVSGNWLVPVYNGLDYLDKPAFYFRTVALTYAVLGVSETSARLSSALAGCGLLLVLYAFCRREYSARTALLAVMIVATMPLFMVFSRYVIFDMTLAFFVCSSIFAAYVAETTPDEAQRKRRHYLAAALGSVATLVKGPVGFIIPLLVITLWRLVERQPGALRRIFSPLHIAIFLLIVAPWFAGVSYHHPDFPYYGIVKESLSRFGTSEFQRTQPFYFYAVIIASCFFPWSALLPEGLARLWQCRAQLRSADRLLMVWTLAVVLFFSISQSKLPGYILSTTVTLGILIARVFALAMESADNRIAHMIMRALAGIAFVCAAIGAFFWFELKQPEKLHALLQIKDAYWTPWPAALNSLVVTLAAVGALALYARLRRSLTLAFAAFLALPLALVTVNFDLMQIYGAGRSSRELARQFNELTPETEVACIRCFPGGLAFYLQRELTVFSDVGDEFTSNYIIFALKNSAERPHQVADPARIDSWLASRKHPVYLIAEKAMLPLLENAAAHANTPVRQLNEQYWATLLTAPSAPVAQELR
ncbi:glycosyltransferase family 39 protein [Candidatus Methylospira mobilis]|uniref:Glycosyltransferase family 39 protein n=1 Tax=Candidatus Methylospira mobilis TaxID=1808979 RepID=A0A5Q0BDX7_9GAMM|nr:glycosyltransferase family 39 protein [Candidatus Methylospira mobilis]QFY41739.1 glycosyltransferase family 39 protein [Candidatus Methylospira mobilis]